MSWKPIGGATTKAEAAELKMIEKEIYGKARFLVDENMGSEIALLVRNSGWNTEFVCDVGLRGHDDSDVMAYAWRKSRIILTHDDDFLDDQKFPFNRNPGVIVLPQTPSARVMVRIIGQVLNIVGNYTRMFRHPKINITEDGHWTVRDFFPELGGHTYNRYWFDERGNWLHWEED